MHCTDVERPKAKKPHRCMSCGEGIAVGETYVRWRMVTAQAEVEVWRSMEASNRGMDRGTR